MTLAAIDVESSNVPFVRSSPVNTVIRRSAHPVASERPRISAGTSSTRPAKYSASGTRSAPQIVVSGAFRLAPPARLYSTPSPSENPASRSILPPAARCSVVYWSRSPLRFLRDSTIACGRSRSSAICRATRPSAYVCSSSVAARPK